MFLTAASPASTNIFKATETQNANSYVRRDYRVYGFGYAKMAVIRVTARTYTWQSHPTTLNLHIVVFYSIIYKNINYTLQPNF